jgi:hypothetical protein
MMKKDFLKEVTAIEKQLKKGKRKYVTRKVVKCGLNHGFCTFAIDSCAGTNCPFDTKGVPRIVKEAY